MTTTDVREARQFIGGAWVGAEDGRTFDDRDPFTGEVVANVAAAGAADATRAVEAAQAAFPAWAESPPAERQRIMDEHIAIGHRYHGIKINTTYSYGLDDQEFVVAFEGNDPGEFLALVRELRDSESSSYTLFDTPMFTCRRVDSAGLLLQIGLAPAERA